MEGWSKAELIERIRALEHELARPVEHRQKIDKPPECKNGFDPDDLPGDMCMM
jgi:hypothetical protein